ncbi:hypothetical protein LINPERPRIM_LOCUS29870 [Linum perenne]
MASDPRTMEGPCNSGTDEETVAFRKKRLRRVSFADVEITSVHVFDRDEDLETPPTDALTKNQTPEDAHEPRNEVLGFFKELADGDDLHEASFNGDEVEDEDEAACASKSFLRPFESPGSSVPGSATSNDGDEFFGPVSANFIRPSRLSDSGASNDNHEVTMDSTAFSMHFRSLIRSESGDLRTPTNVGSGFGEKTPSNMTTPTDPESLMTLTKATKLQLFSDPEDKSTGYKYSDTMSLVGENARSYDYGKLSPNLEAILVEGSKELHCVSVPDCTSSNILKRNESPLKYENGSRHVNQSGYGDKALVRVCALDESAQTEFTDLPEAVQAYHVSAASHGNQKNNAIHSPSRNDCFPTDLSSHEPVESLIHLAELKTPDQQRQEDKSCTAAVTRPSIYAEYPDVSPSKVSNVLQVESVRTLKEDTENVTSSEDKKGNQYADRTYEQTRGSLSTELASSLLVQQQHIISHDAKPFSTMSYVTPSPKIKGSLLIKESRRSAEIVSSVRQSGSRLKETIEKSKLLLSELNSSIHARVSPLKENSNNVTSVPVANLEEHFSAVDTKSIHDQSTNYMQNELSGSLTCIGNFSKMEGSNFLAENEEYLLHMSPSRVFKANPTQPVSEPSEILSLKLKMDHESDAKSTDARDKFASPPTKRPAHKFPFEENSSSLPRHLNQQLTDLATIDLDQDASLMDATVRNSHTTGIANELESWFNESSANSRSPIFVSSHLDDFPQMKIRNDKEQQVDQANLEDVSVSAASMQVLTSGIALSSHQGTPSGNGFIAASNQSKLCMEESKASPNASRYINEPSRIKSPCKEALITSQTREEAEMILLSDPEFHGGKLSERHVGVQNSEDCSLRKRKGEIEREDASRSSRIKLDGILSPNCNTNELSKGNKPFHISHSPVVASDIDSSHICEKRNKEKLEGVRSTCMVGSPNTQATNGPCLDVRLDVADGCNEVRVIGGDITMKHWSDISQKLSADTRDLISPSVNSLKINSIHMIQDILAHLQKLKIRGIFFMQLQQDKISSLTSCHQYYFIFLLQKVCDETSKKMPDRTAEMRNLICKLVFEKARVQLLTIELQKLLKRRNILSIAVQESQMLKSAKALCLPVSSEVNSFAADSCQNGFHSKDKASHEKLVASRHEFEALQEKLKNLTQHFRGYCKIGGDTGCSEIIEMLNDQLNKKISFRFLHEGIQLYEVQHLENRNGVISIVLSYLDFFSQRFTISSAQIPSLSLSIKLNEAKIMTKFANMGACAAFAYVLNGDTTKKYAGSRSLAQETIRTSLVLQNLLDVVQEVQIARIESTNLVDASFSSSVEQLDLQLCFVDVGSHTKMNLVFDMTCLKHGVYPSEILPNRIQVSGGGRQKAHIKSLPAQAKASVDGLRVGYLRIIRICRCISQMMSL